MELLAGVDTQIFVMFLGVVVALGCTLVAFLVDFLKGRNERLRELVLEMTVRQEERARQPQAALDSLAVITALAQVGKNLESVVRSAVQPEAQGNGEPELMASTAPVYQMRRSTDRQPAAVVAAVPEIAVESVAAAVVPAAVVPATVVPAAVVPAEVVAEALVSEPDWRQATWHEEPTAVSPDDSEETPVAYEESIAEPGATVEPVGETLRSLFDTPASMARAAQLDMLRHLDEPIAEAAPPIAEIPSWPSETDEPAVRIRVLNHGAVTPAVEEPLFEEAVVEEPVAVEPVAVEPVAVEPVAEEPVAEEALPVTAALDFLTAADLGEAVAPEPIESFDSLMAAVNSEPGIVPESATEAEAAAEPEEPGVLVLPSGMNDRATLDFLKRDPASFTGLIVSIGINDYARLQETSGRPAAEELAKSVTQLVKSLITMPNGSEFFGCRSADDEFILVFANESGSVAQRRLNGLSERLWDFQLRSLGNFSVMFSWGATEANGETFEDAVEAASERMRETRHNRRTISMDKTRLKKVVNG